MALFHCRLTKNQQCRLVELFVAGMSARAAARLVGVHRNTAAYFFHRLRVLIANYHVRRLLPADRTSLAGNAIAGSRKKRPPGPPSQKVPLFGIGLRGGKVVTQMLGVAPRASQVNTEYLWESIVYRKNANGDARIHVSKLFYVRANPMPGDSGINQESKLIEKFWLQVRRLLRLYQGVPREHFDLFLKECEWRFNGGTGKTLLKQLKRHLKCSRLH